MRSTIEALCSPHSSNLYSIQDRIEKRYKLILTAESNLTVISLYVDHIKERLASFAIARRDMAVREERCTKSNLETARLGGKIYNLQVVVTKV